MKILGCKSRHFFMIELFRFNTLIFTLTKSPSQCSIFKELFHSNVETVAHELSTHFSDFIIEIC